LRPLHKWGVNKNEINFALFCLKNKRNSSLLRVFLGEKRWNLAILICASIYAKGSIYKLATILAFYDTFLKLFKAKKPNLNKN